MKQGLFRFLLLAGILQTQCALRQYHLIQEAKTWTDAHAYCRLNFGNLARVENAIDMEKLLTEAQKYNFISEAWAGLYNDVNSWRCSLNGTSLGSFRKWDTGEPNNHYGDEECIVMGEDGLWRDKPCTRDKFFVCFDAINDATSMFVFVNDTKRTWQDALAFCRQTYTDLACPRDDIENSDIRSLVPVGTSWIGVFRNSWRWSDNARAVDLKWMLNQPDNAGGQDNCAYLVIKPPKKKRQIVRLVVQSIHNANDPAVKTAILDKINAQLQEHGIAGNTTVKWRELPAGSLR